MIPFSHSVFVGFEKISLLELCFQAPVESTYQVNSTLRIQGIWDEVNELLHFRYQWRVLAISEEAAIEIQLIGMVCDVVFRIESKEPFREILIQGYEKKELWLLRLSELAISHARGFCLATLSSTGYAGTAIPLISPLDLPLQLDFKSLDDEVNSQTKP